VGIDNKHVQSVTIYRETVSLSVFILRFDLMIELQTILG